MIAIVGAGVTGTGVLEQLIRRGHTKFAVCDLDEFRAQQLAELHRSKTVTIDVVKTRHVGQADIAVLACGAPQSELVMGLLQSDTHVVSMSDDLDDTTELFDMHEVAVQQNRSLIVGACASPGLTGLLLAHVALGFDSVDEAHVAVHGTGGPDCARQHHVALAGQSIGWHDGSWLRRPSGSGRELCWFPEPVGAYDCYRAEVPDPMLLHRAMPQLQRISARVSATRRDRFTARLPLLAPPNAEGGMGAVRIEVRGMRGSSRAMEIVGVSERLAKIAGVVAATVAHAITTNQISAVGAHVLGDSELPNAALLRDVANAGLHIHQFVGA
jgi:saccharopine dehydrogenase-like NADP-dependent oxidoreductase